VKTTITEFQRRFRQVREAADRGESILIAGENADYIFERRPARPPHPFAGLEGVFGAVTLATDATSLREKVRRRLSEKNRHRRRRTA
jgi:hypothetical protein